MKILLKIAYHLLRVTHFFTRPITLGVRVLMFRGDAVLLVRHSYQDAWFLPGGGIKRGETPEAAIRREVSEECGGTLGRRIHLLGVYSSFEDYHSDHVMLFLAEDFALGGDTDAEIERMAFFSLDRLPVDVSPGCLRRIQEYHAGRLQPGNCRFGAW